MSSSGIKIGQERRNTITDKKIIAIIGATGNQGGGLARAIAADRNGPFVVRAITRGPDSERAVALAKLGVEVMAGDADDPPSLERAIARQRKTLLVRRPCPLRSGNVIEATMELRGLALEP